MAHQLHIPLPFLRNAKRLGCPAFTSDGRVGLAEFIEWVFASELTDHTDWSAQARKFEALLREQKYRQRIGELVSQDAVRGGIAASVAVMFATLERRFLQELPPDLVGRSELEIRKCCETAVTETKRALHEGLAKLSAQTPDDKEED